MAALGVMFAGLNGCGGGGASNAPATATADPVVPAPPVSTPVVTLPPVPDPVVAAPLILGLPVGGVSAATLGVVVAQGDDLSEAIASYYVNARGIPATNVIRVNVNAASDTLSVADFAVMKAEVDAKLPAGIQATLLTWVRPSRVTGSCTMGMTSAMALGYDTGYCGGGCVNTKASPYFDSESGMPWQDVSMRPSMMLGATTMAAAKSLIDRGLLADNSQPGGDGYLLRTSDTARSVRFSDYTNLPASWAGNPGLQLNYIDNSAGGSADNISNKKDVLFYFTGLAQVSGTGSNSFRPGGIADHLTSFGGLLPLANGQMPITAWLDAGATASYGTVEEPCNYTQKFSKASVLIDHYYRGDTLVEAYWKSVQWPGQGLFIGEPLARPFAEVPAFEVVNGQYRITTRSLRAKASYSLQYKAANGSWENLASFSATRAQSQTLWSPLPPSDATQLRWLGPCPNGAAQQCTLATSR